MDSASICEAVLDSLDEQIALIDHEGTIIYVNRAWKQFGIDNGVAAEFESVGSNYLQVCSTSDGSGDSPADEVIRGIRGVASGDLDSFYYEYPCHGPDARRWFLMRVTRLKSDSRSLLVVSHHNITQRKLAEESAEHLARHDPLTGLSNRLHFTEFLSNEWRRSLRDQEPISLVMLDVDHFKDYNDELGHPTGDRCLTKVGHVLQTFSNRASDIAVRYGGEEFAVLLGKTDYIDSQRIAEAIRTSIYDLNIRYGRAKRISISAGVASCVPNKGQDASLLLKEADKALYLAKRKGRNRVVFAGSVGNRAT
jgi:diguanylate cyclase (GGDEF)-like protein